MRTISIEDIIAMNALYRPGPMDYIPEFIQNRKNPEKIVYDCPQLEPILKPTYGVIVYQEQVMQIFRDLAGYSWGRSDLIRRAMSKKKEDVMQAERIIFINGDEELNISGCKKNGIPEEAANKIYDKMIDFAKYAFNKAHAASYSVLSYKTAWLKYYYPAYYFCSIINATDKVEKLADIISDARSNKVKVLPPDINKSMLKADVIDGSILIGLSNIKGVGNAAESIIEERRAGGAFKDIKDFLLRCNISTQNLIDAGAFDSMGYTRESISNDNPIMKDIMDLIKKIHDKDKFITNASKVLDFIEDYNDLEALKARLKEESISLTLTSKSIPTAASLSKRIENAKGAIKGYLSELYDPIMDICSFNDEENINEKYKREKDVLGVYLTGHPIDAYEQSIRTPISDLLLTSKVVSGIISNISLRKDRKGQTFASFTIEDKTGTMKGVAFHQAYLEYEDMIVDGAGLQLSGTVEVDEYNSSENEVAYQIKVDKIAPLPKRKKSWQMVIKNEEAFMKLQPDINNCIDKEGDTLYIIFANHAGDSYVFSYKVNKNIKQLGAAPIY